MDKRRKQSNIPENTLSSLAVNHIEDLTMIQDVYTGTYVEAVFTENYQPTLHKQLSNHFSGALPHLPESPIAAGWTIHLKKSTNPNLGLLKH